VENWFKRPVKSIVTALKACVQTSGKKLYIFGYTNQLPEISPAVLNSNIARDMPFVNN
jgi:hypothetical protein